MKYKSRTHKITFDETTELAGLIVRVKNVQFGELKGLIGSFIGLDPTSLDAANTPDGMLTAINTATAAIDSMRELLSDKIIEWNLTDENEVAIGTSIESLSGLDDDFVLQVFNGVMEALKGVRPGPLGTPSNNTALEGSLLESLASQSS